MKFCKDCAFYRETTISGTEGFARWWGGWRYVPTSRTDRDCMFHRDPVVGNVNAIPCHVSRSYHSTCGDAGRHFKLKEKIAIPTTV